MTSLPKVLDLFSGIGGFSLAAENAGFDVAAHCEIEPFPQAVLAHRFPNVPIFEDVCGIDKNSFYAKTGLFKIGVVCGGSPCQGFSVAGFQRGFGDNRSRLFSEQLRVARALGAEWFVWENVPGALSSNGGADFARVLSELTGWDIEPRKWGGAGYFRNRTDSDFSVCYRVLDTRFFRIPQRRRRIYLVGRLGKLCPPEVLFESDGVRGNFASCGKQKENPSAFAESGFGKRPKNAIEPTPAKSAGAGGGSETLVLTESSSAAKSESPTLTASMSKIYNKQTPILFENHAQDSRVSEKEYSPTLSSKLGTGGGNSPLLVFGHKDNGRDVCADVAPTLRAMGGGKSNGAGGGNVAVCIAENTINRCDENGGNGVGAKEGVSYTLNATGVHGVSDGLRVRRLTPRECERLQGFPDDWTRIPYRGKPAEACPDSPRYKACGNAITVDVGTWVMQRLADFIRRESSEL